MKYRNAQPFFPEEDIDKILIEVKSMLSGEGFLTKGPNVKAFEKAYAEYTGTKYGISTNSCTTALEIVLKGMGIGSGDEVIVPTQTFVATGSSVVTVGAKVVFCDSNEDFLFDFEDLKKKITSRTKAVIIVHFAGLIHPYIWEIKAFLKERNIYLIEDCAHSNGATIDGQQSGSIGDAGCHSFFSTKIMTTGEGGMITTNDDQLFEACSSLRSIGIDVTSGVEIFNRIGSNNRMAEYESILGLSQLNRLEEFVAHRIKIAHIYQEELNPLVEKGHIRFQYVPANIRHPYWKFIVFINSDQLSKSELSKSLFAAGISVDAPYNPLMHLQPIFRSLNNTKEGDLPQAEALVNTHFSLPIHLKISENDAKNIAKEVRAVFI